jgi:hypothetical protein
LPSRKEITEIEPFALFVPITGVETSITNPFTRNIPPARARQKHIALTPQDLSALGELEC